MIGVHPRQAEEANVASDADNLELGQLAIEMHVQLEALANWILSRPEPASCGLADHRNVRAGRGLPFAEIPSAQQGDSERVQIIVRGITAQSSIAHDAFRGAAMLHLDGPCPCAHHGASAVRDPASSGTVPSLLTRR